MNNHTLKRKAKFCFSFLIALLIIVLCSRLFFNKPKNTTKLVIFHHFKNDGQNKLLKILKDTVREFELEPEYEVKISLRYVDVTDIWKLQSIPVVNRPDIFIAPYDGSIANEDLLERSSNLAPQNINIEKFYERFFNIKELFKQSRWNQELGIPFFMEKVILFQNKKFVLNDMLESNSNSISFNQLKKVVKKFGQSKGKSILGMPITNAYYILPWLYSYNLEEEELLKILQSDDEKQIISVAKKFMKLKTLLLNELNIGIHYDEVFYKKFIKGNLAFYMGGTWKLNDIDANKIDYEILPLPRNADKKIKPYFGLQSFYVTKKKQTEKRKKIIWKLLNKFCSEQMGKKIYEKAKAWSALKGIYSKTDKIKIEEQFLKTTRLMTTKSFVLFRMFNEYMLKSIFKKENKVSDIKIILENL